MTDKKGSPREIAVAKKLEDAELGEFGKDIFTGPVRPSGKHVPVDAVFILETPGPPPSRFLSGCDNREHREPVVQVTVRSKNYHDGRQKADSIYNKLLDGGIEGYFDIRSEQSGAEFLGIDDNEYYRFVINFQLHYIEKW